MTKSAQRVDAPGDLKAEALERAAAGQGPRHSPTNAYARGTRTRACVIEAAIEVFGRHGFEHASTREIAHCAGVRAGAIHYYFKSKGDLYYACLDKVTRAIATQTDPLLAVVDGVLNGQASKELLIETYCDLNGSLLDWFFARDKGSAIDLLLASRDDLEEVKTAKNLMRDRVELPVARRAIALVARIMERDQDEIETGLHAYAVSGLTTVFSLNQRRIATTLGWKDPSPSDLALLKRIVREDTRLMLSALWDQAHRRKDGDAHFP